MKKLLFITLILLSSLTLKAQKCIVLDFKIGDNVTAEDVDAISYEFRSSFTPSCYTVEDYLRLKRTMKDLNYDPTTMNQEQIRKLGRDMVAVTIVYGTLNKFMNEYSLDVLVMDVSTGTTIIHESSTFQQSEYHSHPRTVSEEIATKLCNISTKQRSQGSSVNKSSCKKIGCINSFEIMEIMPGVKAVRKTLQDETDKAQAKLKSMQNELETLYNDYINRKDLMSDLIRQTKERELQDMSDRIQEFQESAQKQLEERQTELLKPIIDRAKKTIEDVAKENGYDFIYDSGTEGFVLYQNKKDDDILPLVKKKLGL